jgi:hypothetical protein
MKYVPTINLSADPRQKDTPEIITFSRNCRAYSVGSDGYLSYYNENEIRHEYDPVSKEYLGWLIEQPSRNYVPYSNNLTKTDSSNKLYWNYENIIKTSEGLKSNATDEPHVEIVSAGISSYAPNRKFEAFKFQDKTAATVYRRVNWYPKTVTRNSDVVFSIYAKAADYVTLMIEAQTWTGASIIGTFNLEIGRVENVSGTLVEKEVDMYPLANGWYRLVLRYNMGAGSILNKPFIRLMLVSNTSNYNQYYTGQVNHGLYLWGPQLEIDTIVESSYIESITDQPGFRDGDKMNFKQFTWFNPVEGTFLFESAVRKKLSNSANRILMLHNISNDDTIPNERIGFCTSTIQPIVTWISSIYDSPVNGTYTSPRGYYTRANIVSNELNPISNRMDSHGFFWNMYYEQQQVVADTFYKQALTYKTNEVQYFLNGNATIVDNYCKLPSKINSSYIGRTDDDSHYLNGYLRRIIYYNSKLPADFVQELTL